MPSRLRPDRLAGTGAKANQAQDIVRDTELKGFFVVAGKKTITFTVQVERYANGKRVQTRREKIGTYPDMTADEARRRARSVMETIRAEKPTEEPGLWITSRFRYLLATLPFHPRDETNPEDLDTTGPDHGLDAARYAATYAWHRPARSGLTYGMTH